jgi:hypothetical protein
MDLIGQSVCFFLSEFWNRIVTGKANDTIIACVKLKQRGDYGVDAKRFPMQLMEVTIYPIWNLSAAIGVRPPVSTLTSYRPVAASTGIVQST